MDNQPDKEFYSLTEGYVREIAENSFKAELSPEQMDWAQEKILERLYEVVYESISEVIEYQKLLAKNQDAEKFNPHYKVYYRNPNINWDKPKPAQEKFHLRGSFKSVADAKAFIKLEGWQSGDEWRVIEVDDGVEKEIGKQ